jgi:hypothetical protein
VRRLEAARFRRHVHDMARATLNIYISVSSLHHTSRDRHSGLECSVGPCSSHPRFLASTAGTPELSDRQDLHRSIETACHSSVVNVAMRSFRRRPRPYAKDYVDTAEH